MVEKDIDFARMLDELDEPTEPTNGGFGFTDQRAAPPMDFSLPDSTRKLIDESVGAREDERRRQESIDKAQGILDRYKEKFQQDKEAKFGPQMPGVKPEDDFWGGEFFRSLGRSGVGTSDMLGATMRQGATSLRLQGGAENEALATGLETKGQELSDQAQRITRQLPAARVDDFTKIRTESISSFARDVNDYVQQGVGQVLGYFGPIAVGYGVGGIPGLAVSSGVLGVGEVRQTLEEAGVTDPKLLESYGWLGGMTVAALDALVPGELLTQPVKKGLQKYALQRIVQETTRVGVKEAVTEVMQEMIQIAGAAEAAGIQVGQDRASEQIYNMGRELYAKRWQIANAGALGFIGGKVLATPGAIQAELSGQKPASRLEGIAGSAAPLAESGATIPEADTRTIAPSQEGPTPRLKPGEGAVRGPVSSDPAIQDAEHLLAEIEGDGVQAPNTETKTETDGGEGGAPPAAPPVAAAAAPGPKSTPTFRDISDALPRDSDGHPDFAPLFDQLAARGKRSFNELSEVEKGEVLRALKPEASPRPSPRQEGEAPAPATEAPAAVSRPEAPTPAQEREAAPAAPETAPRTLTEAIQQAAPQIEEAARAAVQEIAQNSTTSTQTEAVANQIDDAVRSRFAEVLASKERRSNWGKAAGLNEQQVQALIQEAVSDGRLTMRKGQPVRTAKVKSSPQAELSRAATSVPMGRAAEVRLERIENDVAYKHAAALLGAGSNTRSRNAALKKLADDKKATRVVLDEIHQALTGKPSKSMRKKADVIDAIRKAEIAAEPARPAAPVATPVEEASVPLQEIVNPIDQSAPVAEQLRQIAALTAESKPALDAQLKAMDAQIGTTSNSNIKKPETIVSKASRPSILATKPWHSIAHIRDTLRFQTKITTFDQIEKAAEFMLSQGYQIVKIDTAKMLEPKEWGWRFAGFDLRAPNGQLVEWYIIFDEMYAAKKKGHLIFEKWRNTTEAERKERRAEYEADIASSYSLYTDSFEAGLRNSGYAGLEDARADISKLSASLPEMAAKFSATSSALGGVKSAAQGASSASRNLDPAESGSMTQQRPDARSSSTSGSAISDTSSNMPFGGAQAFDNAADGRIQIAAAPPRDSYALRALQSIDDPVVKGHYQALIDSGTNVEGAVSAIASDRRLDVSERQQIAEAYVGGVVAGEPVFRPIPEVEISDRIIPTRDLLRDGDGANSPYLLPDGRVVSTHGDHLAFLHDLVGEGKASQHEFGLVRFHYGNTKDGGRALSFDIVDGQVLTEKQIALIDRMANLRAKDQVAPTKVFVNRQNADGGRIDDFVGSAKEVRDYLGRVGATDKAIAAIREAAVQRGRDITSALLHGFSPEVSPSNLRIRDLDAEMVRAALERLSERLPTEAGLVVRAGLRLAVGDRVAALEGATLSPEAALRTFAIDAGSAKKLIAVSLEYGPDVALQTFTHEEIHLLRGLDILKGKNWEALAGIAKRRPKKPEATRILDTLLASGKIDQDTYDAQIGEAGKLTYRQLYQIDARYGEYLNGNEDLLIEETVAHAAADWAQGRQFASPIERVFQRIRDFLEAIQNAMHGLGFRSANDVFESIWAGELTRKFEEAQQRSFEAEERGLEWMRENGVTAMAIRDWIPGLRRPAKATEQGAPEIQPLQPDQRYTEFDEFVAGKRRNAWVTVDGDLKIYARRGSIRPGLDPNTIELANMETANPGSGKFTAFLNRYEPHHSFFVENIFNERLPDYLSKRGYEIRDEYGVLQAYRAAGPVSYDADAAGDAALDAMDKAVDEYLASKGRGGTIMAAFAGESAQTADQAALAKAKDMDASGASRESIWHETGWFKGVDGRWRFEIDDSKSKLRVNGPDFSLLHAELTHDPLFDAYPELVEVEFNRPSSAQYHGSFMPGGIVPSVMEVSKHAKQPRSTALHEAQHALQDIEGFAEGGTIDHSSVVAAYNSLSTAMRSIIEDAGGLRNATPEQRAEYDRLAAEQKRIPLSSDPEQDARTFYNRLAGEVESRTVQKRMNYTADQREDRPPWLDYDVPEDQQIVRMPDGSPKMMASADLDMSEMARLDRAAQMGFDTSVVLYRGLMHPYRSEVAATKAQFFSTDPKIADQYAGSEYAYDGANVVPVYARHGRTAIIDAAGGDFYAIPGLESLGLKEGPMYSTDVVVREAKRAGFDSVIIKNVKDGSVLSNSISDVHAIFDPSNIRSVNASFDPSEGNSPDLMAALRDWLPSRSPTPPQTTPSGESPGLNKIISDLKKTLGMPVSQGLWGMSVQQGSRAARIRPPSNVKGQFDRETGNVSVRQSRDIKTLAHEGGHYLESILGTDLGVVKQRFAEALTGDPNAMPAALSEGFARWFETYILDPEAAERRAPGMTDAFEEVLEAERADMLEGFDTIQQEYQRYIKSAPIGEVASGLSSQYDGTTWRELSKDAAFDNVSGKLSSAYEGVIDGRNVAARGVQYLLKMADFNGIRDADGRPISIKVADNFYKRLRMFAGSFSRGRAWLEKGISDLETGRILSPSLKEALDKAMGDGKFDMERYKQFNQYLVSIRALAEYDRLDQKKSSIKQYDDTIQKLADARKPLAVQGNRQQVARIDETMDRLRRERENASKRGANRAPTAEPRAVHERVIRELGTPEFKEAAQLVHDFTFGLLNARRQAGFISQELFDELAKRKDWYVPFWRDMSDIEGAGAMFPGSGVKKWSMFKKFDGSDRSILMPMEILSEEAYSTAQQVAFNEVIRTMVGLAERVGPGGGKVAERLARAENMQANEETFGKIKQMAIDLGIDEIDAHMITQRMEMNFSDGDIRVIMSPENLGPTAKPQLPLWENGERVMVRLPDPEFGRDLFEAINGLGKEMSDILVKALALPAQMLRVGVTSHPDFIFRNIWRDMWTAWKLTGAVPVLTQIRGFQAIGEKGSIDGMTGEDFRRLYNEAGGVAGGMNLNVEVADSKRDVRDLLDTNIDKKAIAAGAALGGFTGVAAGSSIGSLLGLVFGGPVGAGVGFKIGAAIGGTVGGVGIGYAARHGEVWRAVESVETATRLGVAAHAYKRAKAHNPDLSDTEAMLEAAFVSRDILDWNRRGSKMLAATRLVTFLNAQIQGLDKQLRQMSAQGDRGSVLGKHLQIVLKHQSRDILSRDEERDLSDAYKSYVRWAAISLMLMGLYALMGDDDDYQDIKDTTKWTHSWFKSLGIWFRLPKPFELAVPSNIGEIVWDKMRGYDQRLGERIVDSMYEVLAPPGLPQVMRLTGGVLFNRDRQGIFAGRSREIVGENLASRPPHERYHAFTSEFAIDLAKAIDSVNRPLGRTLENVVPVFGKKARSIVESTTPAPVMIDFVLSAAGAYWGREVQNSYQTAKTVAGMSTRPDRKATDFPILRGFTGEAARQSQSVEEMYSMISREGGEFTMAATEYKQLIDDRGRPAEADMWLKGLDPEQRVWALTQYYGSRSDKREHPLERARQADAINREIMRDTIVDTLAPKVRQGRRQVRDFEERIELTPAKKTEVLDVLARLSQVEARNTMILLKRPGFEGLSIKDPKLIIDELKAVSKPVHDLLMERRDKKVEDWPSVHREWPRYRDRVLKEGERAF